MQADQLVEKKYFKGLIYGDAGSGKTCLAAQFPGPIEYWDFDHKISSAVNYLKRLGKGEQLKQIDVHQFSQLPVKERIPAFEKRTQLIDKYILDKKPLPFATLVIDSVTTLSNMIMEDYIFRSQLAMKRPMVGVNSLQEYQLFAKHMTRLLTGILAQDINVVVLAHIEAEKDDNTGLITRRPLVTGKSLGPNFPVWFEEVYAVIINPDGTRKLLTQPSNNYIVRGQRGLDKEIPMDIKEILK